MSTGQHKRGKPTVIEEDRISSLPYDVLRRIVSFLPTKLAAPTASLSATWHHIFYSSPNLDFDDSSADVTSPNGKSLFLKFVFNLLHRRNFSPISKFRLRFTKFSYDVKKVTPCIKYAICSDQVREIDVHAVMTGPATLPLMLYTLETLTTLKLCGNFVIDVPEFAYLPQLKIMRLEQVEFRDDDSARRLFSHCPMLEDLNIWCCVMKNISILKIFTPALKQLMYYGNEGLYGIVLNSPNLEEMCFSANLVVWGIQKYTLKSLDRAVLFLHKDVDVSELVIKICDVRFLTLSGDSMQALFGSDKPLPIFPNLTHLELIPYHCIGWKFLPGLLASSPRLEIISFKNGLYDRNGDILEAARYLPEAVPTCVYAQLKEVKVGSFQGEEEEFQMLEYFLKNAKVLEKITISPSPPISGRDCHILSMKDQFLTIKRLLKIKRCSRACRIVFTEINN